MSQSTGEKDSGAEDFWDLLHLMRQPSPPRRAKDPCAIKAFTFGPSHVPARLYSSGPNTLRPLLIYYHGGGWVGGHIDDYDWMCCRLASRADCLVMSVDYRLAPEHPYPVPLDDCYEALLWAEEQGAAIGCDTSRLGVAGSSSGGNLAAAVALRAVGASGPPLTVQVLVNPVLDSGLDTSSYAIHGQGPGLTRQQMAWFWDQYAPAGNDRSHPWLSPLRAENLAGLPPTMVVTADLDPLRDEGAAYGDRLRSAGIPTVYRCWSGQLHGFTRLVDDSSVARAAIDEIADYVRSRFWASPNGG